MGNHTSYSEYNERDNYMRANPKPDSQGKPKLSILDMFKLLINIGAKDKFMALVGKYSKDEEVWSHAHELQLYFESTNLDDERIRDIFIAYIQYPDIRISPSINLSGKMARLILEHAPEKKLESFMSYTLHGKSEAEIAAIAEFKSMFLMNAVERGLINVIKNHCQRPYRKKTLVDRAVMECALDPNRFNAGIVCHLIIEAPEYQLIQKMLTFEQLVACRMTVQKFNHVSEKIAVCIALGDFDDAKEMALANKTDVNFDNIHYILERCCMFPDNEFFLNLFGWFLAETNLCIYTSVAKTNPDLFKYMSDQNLENIRCWSDIPGDRTPLPVKFVCELVKRNLWDIYNKAIIEVKHTKQMMLLSNDKPEVREALKTAKPEILALFVVHFGLDVSFLTSEQIELIMECVCCNM